MSFESEQLSFCIAPSLLIPFLCIGHCIMTRNTEDRHLLELKVLKCTVIFTTSDIFQTSSTYCEGCGVAVTAQIFFFAPAKCFFGEIFVFLLYCLKHSD